MISGELRGRVASTARYQQYLAMAIRMSTPSIDCLFKARLELRTAAPHNAGGKLLVFIQFAEHGFLPEAFPLIYLPCHVSFRMTDIWRSSSRRQLCGRKAIDSVPQRYVVQERNEHNLMKDFRDEVDGYLTMPPLQIVYRWCSRSIVWQICPNSRISLQQPV